MEVSEELWKDEALVVSGKKENLETWKARTYIKENIDEIRKAGTTVDELVEAFSWVNDDCQTQHPDGVIIQLCLDWAGKSTKEYDDLHKAALRVGCGVRVPELDDNGQFQTMKINTLKSKRFGQDGMPIVKVRYAVITKSKNKQCEGIY